MPSINDSPNYSIASSSPPSSFSLISWITLSLLGVFATLANTPAPRRIFLAISLLLSIYELLRRGSLLRAYAKYFLPWIFIVLLSGLWSPQPSITLTDALLEVMAPLGAGLLAFSLASRQYLARYLHLPFWMLAFSALLTILGGLHTHIGFWPDAPKFVISAYSGRGVASTLAIYFSLIGAALLTINWQASDRAAKPPIFLGASLLLAGILLGSLGNNRMFWYAALVSLLPWLTLTRGMTRNAKAGLAIGLITLILLGISYSNHFAKGKAGAAPNLIAAEITNSYTNDPRWLLWQHWLSIAAEHPWLGFGYSNRITSIVGQAHFQNAPAGIDPAAEHHAHNVALNIVIQTGLLGLLCFLAALRGGWQLIFSNGASVKASTASMIWRLAAFSLLLGGLCKSMTDDFFWGPAGIVMWLMIGTMAGISRRNE